MPEHLLVLRNPKQDIEQLLLFYEMSIPLARVLSEIGPIENPKMTLRPTFKISELSPTPDIAEIINKAHSTEMVIRFRNISEATFERLALRFRPFFLEGEQTKFLEILNILKAKNPELHPELNAFKESWQKAVFGNRIGLRVPDSLVTVNAERLIRIGFYSKYFHSDSKIRAEAVRYETALGKETYWVALISSVWERAQLVATFAVQLRQLLLDQGFATEADLALIEEGDGYPTGEFVEIALTGRIAEFKVLPS